MKAPTETRKQHETPKAKSTRAGILSVALRLFRQRGFEATGMRDIAQAAGLSAGAAYYHFSSKEELVLSFYQQLQESHWSEVEILRKSHTRTRDRLEGFTRAMFRDLGPHRRFVGVLIRNGVDPKSPLSPFHPSTIGLRNEALAQQAQLLEGGDVAFSRELAPHAAGLFWLLGMGFVLFWAFDPSRGQKRTSFLITLAYDLVFQILRLQKLPPLRPIFARLGKALDTLSSPGETR